MKNLRVQFKLIIIFCLCLNFFNILNAKNIDNFSNAKDIANYFSGILAINDSKYQKSHSYFKSLNNLEDSYYRYSEYYQYSLIALKKFKVASKYSRKLEKKNLDTFESNLIIAVYYLKNKNFDKAKLYFKKLKNQSQPGSVQSLFSTSLYSLSDFENSNNLKSALNHLDFLPKKFENIKNIQKVLTHCYFDSNQTDKMFEKLTSNPNVNYSRYFFFHANYLISKNNEYKAKKILGTSLRLHPNNLILNQLKIDLKKKKLFNDQFDCKNPSHIMAEVFYVVANGLAAQANYITSNYYLNLAEYLNPNFLSFKNLYAENFYSNEKHEESKEIYGEIKKHGSIYSWHASKQIASILIEQKKSEEAINYLNDSFAIIKNPTVEQIYDYAEFLKNNKNYKKSIQYYSKVLGIIDTKHNLYAKVLDGRGVAYERDNQWNKAENDLLNSLKAYPENAYVINYLAYSWIEKGINNLRALDMLKKANKLRPNDSYIIDSLGWALFKLKNYKEAKKYLELAIRYMASDPVINDHYADSLWMNNNSLQARYYWNYVLKLEKTEEKLKKEIKHKLLFGLKS